MIPIAGSAYTYGYATLGEFIAWIIGWDLILEYLFAASTVAVGWSGYFTAFLGQLGIHIPRQFTSAPFGVEGTHTLVRSSLCVDPATNALITAGTCDVLERYQQVNGFLNMPAMVLVAHSHRAARHRHSGVGAVQQHRRLRQGRDRAARDRLRVHVRELGELAAVHSGEHRRVRAVRLERDSPRRRRDLLRVHRIRRGIHRGAGSKESATDLPIGILGSLAICTVLYILMALVMTGLAPYTELNVPHPVFVAIAKAGPSLRWLAYLINIGAIAGLASVVLVMLIGQPRIFYSMARDGLLPAVFSKVHPKFRTPYLATIITGTVAMCHCRVVPDRAAR